MASKQCKTGKPNPSELSWNFLWFQLMYWMRNQDISSYPCKLFTGVTDVCWWKDEVFREPPFQMNTMNVMSPFSFKDWLDKQRPSLASGRPVNLFGAQFETEVLGIIFSKKCIRFNFNILLVWVVRLLVLWSDVWVFNIKILPNLDYITQAKFLYGYYYLGSV